MIDLCDCTVTDLPLALADLHRDLAVGARVHVETALDPTSPDERRLLRDIAVGGGFTPGRPSGRRLGLRRQHTLADTVASGMRLLVIGLNPSPYAADHGVAFARPGNRFWPAALDAGLVERDRDPRAALVDRGVGMTDLVKRVTARAAQLRADEYRRGLARIGRLVDWLAPERVCFVGLAGWRAAFDTSARAGWQPEPLGAVPVYLMPSTSGLNAHSSLAELTDHLRVASGR